MPRSNLHLSGKLEARVRRYIAWRQAGAGGLGISQSQALRELVEMALDMVELNNSLPIE